MNTRVLSKAKAPSRPTVPTQEQTSPLRRVKASEPTEIPSRLRLALESPGHPLDVVTRKLMESRFGHDFSQVRVHTDEKAAASARTLDAAAFTINQDIFFAAGHYQPHTHQGQWLLAHELTHTLQQRQISSPHPHTHPLFVQPSQHISSPAPLEREATLAASYVVTNQSIPKGLISIATPHAQGIIARQPATLSASTKAPQALDPARLTEFLVGVILKNLQADPQDRSGRVRRQLAQMTESTRQGVLDRLRDRLPQSQWQNLTELLAEPAPDGGEELTPIEPSDPEPAPEQTQPTNREEAPSETPAETSAESAAATTQPETATEEQTEEPTDQASTSSAPETAPTETPPTAEPTEETETRDQAAPDKPTVEGTEAEATEESQKAEPAPTESTATPATPQAGGAGEMPARAGGAGEAPANTTAIERLEQRIVEANPETEQIPATTSASPTQPLATADAVSPVSEAVEPERLAEAPTTETLPPEETATPTGETPEPTSPATPPTTSEPPAEADAASPLPEPAGEAAEASPESATSPESVTPASVEEAPAETAGEAPPVAAPEPTAESPDEAAESAPASEPEPSATVAEETAEVAGSEVASTVPTPFASPTAGVGSVVAEPVTTEAQAVSPTEAVTTPVGTESVEMPAGATTPTGSPEAGEPASGTEAPQGEQQGGGKQGCPAGTKEAAAGETPEAGGEAGTGGGGGGAAITEEPVPTPPDVSQADPVEAMGTVRNLRPVQLQQALGGVSAAATKSVSEQRSQLADNPPQVERPSGAPAGQQGQTTPPTPTPTQTTQQIERVPEGQPAVPPTPAPLPAAPSLPTQSLTGPRVSGNAQQQLSEADVQQVQAAVQNLPTTDPALNVDVGPAPTLTLEGNADPARAREQRDRLNQTTQAAQTQAQQDIARPMGENELYPAVPQETLRAEISGDGGGAASPVAGGVAAGEAGGGDEAASILAQEQHGDEIRASVSQAQQDMTAKRQEQETQTETAQTENQRQIDEEIQRNAERQTAERSRAREAVQQSRQEWGQEQQTLTTESRNDADQAGQQLNEQVARHQREGNTQAAQQVQEGNTRIANKRRETEQQAAQKRREAERESGGILGWLASRLRSFFQGIFDWFRQAFEAARNAIQSFIAEARRRATEYLEQAQQAIASAIRTLGGDRLLEIGESFLNRLRELGDQIVNGIRDALRAAWNAITNFVNQLREAVVGVLNWLANRLREGLALLERAWQATVNAVQEAVRNAIQSARNALQSLAAFAALVQDVAANPGQWLRNLGAAVMDGIRNHLWTALKTAVKNWFNSKVEEVLSIGTLIQILIRGCISFGQIARMAWQAIISALPMMVIQLLIEKLVALIVPAAAAVMLIIQGLQAAWGAMSRIIAAINAFVAFLQAVKSGNAGPQFANLLATAAVAVIDFVANFLLARLASGLRGVGQRLRGIAQRLQRFLGAVRRGAGAAARGVRTVVRAVVQGGRRVVQTVVRGARAAGRAVVRVARRAGQVIARTRVGRVLIQSARRVGGAAVRGYQAIRRQVQRARDSFRQWNERRRARAAQRRAERERRRAERQARARQETIATINRLISRGISHTLFRLQLLRLKLQYRWRILRVRANREAGTFVIEGGFSPVDLLTQGTIVLEVVTTNVSVKMPPPSRGFESEGRRYAAAVHRDYVTDPTQLPTQLFPGRQVQVSALFGPSQKYRGLQSTLNIVRLHPEMGIRVSDEERRPDYRAEVYGRRSTTGLKELQEVHLIEVTLVTDFKNKREQGGKHKVDQFIHTLNLLNIKYPRDGFPDIRMVYTFVTPGQPSTETRRYINETVNNLGLADRVRVVWRIVPVI